MAFNSITFAVFILITFSLYWFVFKNQRKVQNVLILVASYVFYGWWDWRFLSLIILSSIVDFVIGGKLDESTNENQRKIFLSISLLFNLGMLFTFKYFNFFVDSFTRLFESIGFQVDDFTLNIVLPVGISFYTFQTLSYSIDIYKGNLKAEKDIISFFAFVSFFPQLVAGPIERARNLLPQFAVPRVFDYQIAKRGMHQILWGLFKKVVIADNCGLLVDSIYSQYETLPAPVLLFGAFLFSFQIYCDFSGYSDIAIGTAKLFGFDLMINFRVPYFSRDIAEFWRRWHISLSTWFRDYLYIPLGGSRGGLNMKIRNTFIIFLVSGLWHGANWTFVFWGALNALFILPLMLSNSNRKNTNEIFVQKNWAAGFREFSQILTTFLLTTFAWVFFRAENIQEAFSYLYDIANNSWSVQGYESYFPLSVILSIIFMLVIDWIHRNGDEPLKFEGLPKAAKYGLLLVIGLMILILMPVEKIDFIYFQF